MCKTVHGKSLSAYLTTRISLYRFVCRLINGRAAMVGLTIMLFQEALTNVATFAH